MLRSTSSFYDPIDLLLEDAVSEPPELVLSGFGGEVRLYSGEPPVSGDGKTYGSERVLCKVDWDESYVAELCAFAQAVQAHAQAQAEEAENTVKTAAVADAEAGAGRAT